MALIDDTALAKFKPHEAQIMLEKLGEIYKTGINAREAVELNRIEKVLKVRASQTYREDD